MAATAPVAGAFNATALAATDGLLARVRALLGQGAATLPSEVQPEWDEPAITSKLVLNMNAVLATSDEWDNLCVADNARVASVGRMGKDAPQVDITVYFARRPRWELCIEAKILQDPRRRHQRSETEYIGKEGIHGGFVEEYYTKDCVAAMLGYVRSHTAGEWWTRLHAEITSNRVRLGLEAVEPRGMDPSTFAGEWRTRHSRRSLAPITLFHVFLDCGMAPQGVQGGFAPAGSGHMGEMGQMNTSQV